MREIAFAERTVQNTLQLLTAIKNRTNFFPAGEFFSSKPEVSSLEYFNKYDPVLASTQNLRDKAVTAKTPYKATVTNIEGVD